MCLEGAFVLSCALQLCTVHFMCFNDCVRLQEVYRVLRPGGMLAWATNGPRQQRKLDLVQTCGTRWGIDTRVVASNPELHRAGLREGMAAEDATGVPLVIVFARKIALEP